MSLRVPVPRPLANSDATLAISVVSGNRTRSFEIRPGLAIALSLGGALLLSWYLVATLYFVFRDELLAKILQQQTEMQYAYEDRLAAMRTHLDRVASRQLVDQDSVESKVQGLMARQAQLENRHAMVASLADKAGEAGIRTAFPNLNVDRSVTGSVPAYAPSAKPQLAPDSFNLRTPGMGGPTPLEGSAPAPLRAGSAGSEPRKTIPGRVSSVANGLDRIELAQLRALEIMNSKAKSKADTYDAVLSEVGIATPRVPQTGKQAAITINEAAGGTGGPFVAVSPNSAFERQILVLRENLSRANILRKTVEHLPLGRPLDTDAQSSSGFGPRVDPFTRGSAMHTGIDFRSPAGTSVRATAGGKVVEAGWSGGYGNMVEIDHGNGITTRYAHLSSISVSDGESVARGAIIGAVGSTGRSTGPHLHYEVRVSSDAVDPQRFLRAGQRLPAAR